MRRCVLPGIAILLAAALGGGCEDDVGPPGKTIDRVPEGGVGIVGRVSRGWEGGVGWVGPVV